MEKLDRVKLLAAELFSYSLDNYADHVEIGNERFTKIMPNDINTLLKAEKENWTEDKIAEELEIDRSQVKNYIERFEEAKKIVDAINPSESFRYSVLQSIKQALNDGLKNEEDVDKLVIQICYRTADLGYLLELEGKSLSDYSEWLRRDKDVDYTNVGLPNLE
jgi:predicted transcriptional regulator